MKKILYSVLAIAMTAFTFTSCEDVPAPYDDPNDNPIDQPVTIEPSGDGTEANPYNVAAIIAEAEKLSAGDESSENFYIKGIVTNITENYDGGFGNATYYISDDEDATNSFYIYRSKYFGNTSYSSGDLLEYGDTVVVYGKITNYNGTLETSQNGSYLISINGEKGGEQGGGGDEPTPSFEPEGDGTLDNPFNSIAAYQFAAALGAGEESENAVYIKGIVSQIRNNYDSNYRTADYYISVDGTFDSADSGNQFYVYASNYLNNEKYTSGDLLSVGDEVVVYGKVTNYKGNTPETLMNESYLYDWNKGEGGGSEDTGDPEALNGGFESWTGGKPSNWESASTASSASLSQSDDAHSGSYSVRVGGDPSGNKRLSYKELELEAGDYTMEFWVKAATANSASVRPGYAIVDEDGKISGGNSYVYGDYVNDITNTGWVKVTHTFTLDAAGTYCVLIMNAKNPGYDVLIDDFRLTTGSTVIIE